MENIGALQEALAVAAKLKKRVFNRFLKSTESETGHM